MAATVEEPPFKRRKLYASGIAPTLGIQDLNPHRTPSTPNATESTESSFVFDPLPQPHTISPAGDFTLDITNYIPAGCLRVHKEDFRVSSGLWATQSFWSAFSITRDVYNTRDQPFLHHAFQDILLKSKLLRPYEPLLNVGLIRLEFKIRDEHCGQIRVYILRDDVGNSHINRNQRTIHKGLKHLIRQLDLAKETWEGHWTEHTPILDLDHCFDQTINSNEDESLFNLFNSLPSPAPDPGIVEDLHAKEAMNRILASDIEGLGTLMYSYQRRTAALMLQRESQPRQIIDPRLRRLVDQKGLVWYCDPDSATVSREPRMYTAARGGICAENMGLGKTLICLSLILATRDLSSEVPAEYSLDLIPTRKTTGSLLNMVAATIGRGAVPWKNEFSAAEAQGMEFTNIKDALRREAGHYFLPTPAPSRSFRRASFDPPRKIWLSTATIVVVPANLIQQWCGEIKKHTTDSNSLKVLVMHKSQQALPPAEELKDFDIILFSKLRFDKEATDLNTTSNMPSHHCKPSKRCRCSSKLYRSPLRDIHFKRLIFDEGHSLGNSSNSAQTEAFTLVNSLQVTARWVVSGTPTRGLYGEEAKVKTTPSTPRDTSSGESDNATPTYGTPISSTSSASLDKVSSSLIQEKLFHQQERNDLVKLGNIATHFLRARPWAASPDGDIASWSHHVMQPRHGSKSHGNVSCLKTTLEGLIIRHRPSDVILDVALPPLYQDIVYLDGCVQTTLTLNTFNLMIITNAITSERKDADYFFHPRQRRNLLSLVSNLRQGSFFWSGFTTEHVQSTVETAKRFLEKGEVPVSPEDASLLKQAIDFGENLVSNEIFRLICNWHEMPMFVRNDCPDHVRNALSLTAPAGNPTLMGATMIHDAQKFVASQLWKEDPMDGLVEAIAKSFIDVRLALDPPESSESRGGSRKAPNLAGGVSVGDDLAPRKRSRMIPVNLPSHSFRSQANNPEAKASNSTDETTEAKGNATPGLPITKSTIEQSSKQSNASVLPLRSILKKTAPQDNAGTLNPDSLLNSAVIISTASTKLSYLMHQIVLHQAQEKILVFYETNNIAYYIAQALECLNIKHLIYAKDLRSETRSRYVATFNSSSTFRVLLMDVSQAAFGLDLSSASRVYFVNPVFSPQVEAQAVKRAHRIGQTKPVHVETLVLRGSIEEVIVNRRNDLTNEEHNKRKSILDDQTVYEWIKNVKLLPLPKTMVPGPEQMAKLERPQKVFGIGAGAGYGDDLSKDVELG